MTETLESPSSAEVARSVASADAVPGASVYYAVEGTFLRTFAPLVDGPPPEQGVCGWADAIVQVVGGALSLPGDLVEAGLAGITSAIIPPGMGTPAANIGAGMHLGLPHLHPQTVLLGTPLPGFGPTVVVGALNVTVGGMPALRCGDVGFALGCMGSPTFEVFTGSSSVFIGGKRAARAFDFTRHCDPFAALLTPAPAIGSALDLMSCAAAATSFAAHVAASATHDQDAADAADAGEAEIARVESAMEMQQAFVNSAQILADASLSAMTSSIGLIPPVGLMGDGLVMGAPVATVLIGGLPLPGIADIVNAWAHHWMRRLTASRRRPGRAHPEANAGECQEGHPIGLFEGNVFDDFVDASLGPILFGRHYDTRARGRASAVGRGHRHTLDRELRVWLHRCEYVDERGTRFEFPAFRGRDEVHCAGRVLRRTERGRYEVRSRGELMRFVSRDGERDARLCSLETQKGTVVIERRGDGALMGFCVGERRFDVETDERSRITAIHDARGRPLVHYAYDPEDCLVGARDAAGHEERFGYDADRRLVEWRDKRGYRYTWRYDDEGRCVFSTGADGQWRTEVEYLRGKTRVTRGSGHVFVHHFDPRGLVTRIDREDGGYLLREPDLAGRIVREIDAGGRKVEWLYDEVDAHVGRLDRFGHVLPPKLEASEDESPLARQLPETLAPQLGLRSDAAWHEIPSPLPASLSSLAQWALPAVRSVGEWSTEEDAMGRISREVDPRGHAIVHRRDSAGNLVEHVDRDGSTTRFEIVGWNLVGAVTDPAGRRRQLGYTPVEAVASYRDPNGNLTEYARDAAERVTRIVRNGAQREEYVLDAGDRLIEKRDGEGRRLLRVTPHANALPGAVALESGGRIDFDYDARGRPTRASTESHDVRLARDEGDVVLLDRRDGRGARRWHIGLRETTSLFDRFESHVDATGAVTVVHDPTGRIHTFDSAERGRVTRALSNGTREILAFDEDGRIEGRLAHRSASDGAQICWAVRYERSPEGDLLSLWDSIRGQRRFEIDAAHRLSAEIAADGTRISYVLDAADNVLEKPGFARAVLGPGNVLRATDREMFEHDARERLSARRGGERDALYSYDSLDQLVRVDDGAKEPWTATYDGLGRRCRFGRGASSTELFWDGDRVAAELAPTGALRVHVYACAEALIPFMFVDYASVDAEPASGRSYFVFHDASGMPIQIEDETGRTVWWVDRVDPFGALEIHADAEIDYRLRWPGHYADADLGLHYNRYRDYDPTLARYLQPDPIGHAGSPGSLYAYAPNPLIAVDLEGLTCSSSRRTSADEAEMGARPLRERPALAPEPRRRRPVHLGQLSPLEMHALAAAPNDGPDGRPSRLQIDARRRVAYDFTLAHGQKRDRATDLPARLEARTRRGELKGIDYNHPVSAGPPPPITSLGPLGQWQVPGGSRGSYFAPPGSTPSSLGIGAEGRVWSLPGEPIVPKVERTHTFQDPSQSYLASTAAPIVDTWSAGATKNAAADRPAGFSQPAAGGGRQYTVYAGCDKRVTSISS